MGVVSDQHSFSTRRPLSPGGVLCSALLFLFFAPSWRSLFFTWTEERAHGFLVSLYCIWFLWSKRSALQLSDHIRWEAVAGAVVGATLWVMATVVGTRVIHQGAAVFTLVAWGQSLFDTSGRRLIRIAGSFFLLALPLWEVLLPILQGVTIVVNHLLIGVFGIPADLQDNLIKFPFGTIEVAQSCAGLAFFSTAVTIAAIYAHHFLVHWRARAAAVLLAMMLSMVSNWVRVFGLVYIGYSSKMQSPLMADHNTYGWIIFAAVMAVYFWLTARIESWDRALVGDAPAETGVNEPVLSAAGNGSALYRVTCLTALPMCAFFALDLRDYDTTLAEPIPGVQRAVADWTVASTHGGSERRWKPAFRGEAIHSAEMRTPADTLKYRIVQIDRFGYKGARDGHELIGYGNNIADLRYVLQQGPVGPLDANLRTVNQAIVRDSTGAHLAWYWYSVAGVQTASTTRAKLLELAAFVGRRTPSEVIVLSARCDVKDCNRAVASLYHVATGRDKP